MNNNNDEQLQRQMQALQQQAEWKRLRRDVGYAALPAKAAVGAGACFGFLILAMVVVFGLTFACDVMRGCYAPGAPKGCLDEPVKASQGGH